MINVLSKQYFPVTCIIGIVGFVGMYYSVNWLMDSNSNTQSNSNSNNATDSDFHEMIVSKSNDVNNSVTATLAGQENPSDSSELIRIYKQNTIHDTTYLAEEREINGKYRDYLNAAYTVVMDYVQKSGNLSNDVETMNEMRNLI